MKPKLFVSVLMILCLSLTLAANQALPQVKKFPHLELNSLEAMKPNGEYVISVWKDGRWQEAGRLAYDKFLREREFDLSPYLAGIDAPKIKITERGPGAAHVDSVLLGGRPPEAAEGHDSGRILKKLSVKDNDVINSQGESFELAFPEKTVDKTLRLAARIESARIGTEPIQFPYDNLFTKISPDSKFYSYALNESAPPQGKVGGDEYLKAVGQRPAFFKVFAPTGSGHPSGITYGWVSNDEKNLYVTLDFTPDNTYDGDKDYAKVYVSTGREVKEFKVSVPETQWGMSHFTYTDKVAYEHKVYDFVIPLSEICGAETGRELRLAFAAYGTAAAMANVHPALAYDPDHRRYLVVFEGYEEGTSDLIGQLIDVHGNIIQVGGQDWFVISNAVGNQKFPDVAYDSAAQRFLAVWQDERSDPMCDDIFGQMVNTDGTLYGDNFVIATDYLCQYRPAVANDSIQHQFLVVWYQHYEVETGYDIWGQLVSGEGALIPPALDAPKAHAQSTANGATYFLISDALGDQTNPAVAFDSLGNEYLVVFRNEGLATETLRKQAFDAVANYNTINGQFIQWDGVPLYTDTDINLLISNPAINADNPCIANDNVNHRFLVAWADFPMEDGNAFPATQGNKWSRPTQQGQDARPTHQGQGIPRSQWTPRTQRTPGTQRAQQEDGEQPFIYGQLVDTAGNLLYEDRFLVSNESEDLPPWVELNQNNPAAAFDSGNQQYLVVNYDFSWDWDYDEGGINIGGRILSAAGEVLSDWIGLEWWWDYSPVPDFSPDVAFNPFCRNFLVTWPSLGKGANFPNWSLVGPEECVGLPEVTTTAVTQITNISATSGGNVTSDGGAAVTVRGVCWNTTGGPTTGNSHTTDGSGLGTFISHLTGLSPNTKYFVRAYAVNSEGTGYGNELTFTTLRQFQVTFVAGTGGSVSGTLVQVVPEGGDCTPVEAKADTGFCFINWTGTTGFAGSSANPLTVTNVRQDMTITANFGKFALVVQKLTEKAWIVKKYYGKVVLSVDGLDPSVSIKYVLNRKQSGGEYKLIKEFSSSDLKNNAYTYEDKFLEAEVTYIYQVVAYNASGQVIGRSQEITVQ